MSRPVFIIMRKEIKVIVVAVIVFLIYRYCPFSPLACLTHHPACKVTSHRRDLIVGTFFALAYWVIFTAGCRLPGEHRNRWGLWTRDR